MDMNTTGRRSSRSSGDVAPEESIVCDADPWASCIGGAAQQDAYRDAIEAAGLGTQEIRDNRYRFISEQVQ